MSPTSNLLARLRGTAAAFARAEDGLMTIYGTGIFVMMMLCGGVALDFMRFEAERAKLQYTLDRAVLAAASLSQERDRTMVIQDYFRAAGLGGYALDIEVVEDVHFRTITAETSAPVRSLFLNMLGVDSITAPAASGATERIRNLEISLILDVSGSMGWDQKIDRLHDAASEFVEDMLRDREDLVSISIVPYNGKVNTGSLLAGYYAHGGDHALSDCARFDEADFLTSSIAAGTVLTRLAHFDTVTDDRADPLGGLAAPHCPTDDTNAILPFSNDAEELTDYIESLEAQGWTAIDVAMKWGTALLDPSARGRVNAMIDDGHVESTFEDRPVDYDQEGTIKIAVVMTDGENTSQFDLESNRRGAALSPFRAYHPDLAGGGGQRTSEAIDTILADEAAARYSVWFTGLGKHYEWLRDDLRSTPVGGGDAVQLSWHEVASLFSVDYVQDQLLFWSGTRTWTDASGNARSRQRASEYAEGTYIPDEDYYAWVDEIDEQFAGPDRADQNLSAICRAARNEGVLIYAISFLAPERGETAMADCAHAAGFYFDVDDGNIQQAFQNVAASIHALKLTQ